MMDKYKTLLQGVVTRLDLDLSSFRVGRVSAGLLDSVSVDIAGQKCRLMQIAAVTVLDASTLSVKPYDASMLSLSVLDKAIQAFNLGVSTTIDADVVRVRVPKTTEDDRKKMVKTLRQVGESAKVVIRNLRRDAMSDLKSLKNTISTDDHDKKVKEVEKLVKDFITKVDTVVLAKEESIMSF